MAAKGYRRHADAAFKRLETGELQTMFGLRLSQEDAAAVAGYAQHMGITPIHAVRELMKIGLASDPMSAVVTAARWTAYEEMRRYVTTRFSVTMKEVAEDLSGLISGDPNANVPPGYK